MDDQPFYCLAEFTYLLILLSTMNVIPPQLAAIHRDWGELGIRRIPLVLLTVRAARALLMRFVSLKIRLIRCRNVRSIRAKSLRASLLRAVFSGWRSILKKLLRIPQFRDITIAHFQSLIHETPPLDPNNWAVKLLALDPATLQEFIPEIRTAAPVSAQTNKQDPFWRALKTNLSAARL